MSANATQLPPPTETWHGPVPPTELTHNASSLQLISQGAEARVWLVTIPRTSKESIDTSHNENGSRKRSLHVGSGIHVPQLHSFSQYPSPLLTPMSAVTTAHAPLLKVICKERFSKKYRHPQLDATLTKSRTKGEARSLIRCQRAAVPCTKVLAYALWSNKAETVQERASGKKEGHGTTAISITSSCLFLEYVEGCTVRQYLEQRFGEPPNKDAAGGDYGAEPMTKRPRCDAPDPDTTSTVFHQGERTTTVIDSHTLCVASTIGSLVAKMHTAGVIHGDLTTSNIMIRNPTRLRSEGGGSDTESAWTPQLVLIDFGLATSTAPVNPKANPAPSNKKAKPLKQQHNSEEKAVDLYVLERAFLSTHPGSELLVEEVLTGYRRYFESLDCGSDECMSKGGTSEAEASISSHSGVSAGTHSQVVKAVLTRLQQVRMRGRKRECFG